MKITNHWLDVATRIEYPEGYEMSIRRFAVAHFTSGASAISSIEFWKTPAAKGAEAHVIIDRDGTIYQLRALNQKADHAGLSSWKDPKTGVIYNGLNNCSIGIEFANAGDSANEDGTAFSSHKFKLPEGYIKLIHKNESESKLWEVYPEVQILAGIEVFKALVKKYNLDDIVGHDDIAPARKIDPGPSFPMQRIREECGLQGLPQR